jgi:hypothetical protein
MRIEADKSLGSASTPSSSSSSASLSKSLSATLVAALVGDGTTTWDVRIGSIETDFALADPWVARGWNLTKDRVPLATGISSTRRALGGGAGAGP